MFYYLVRPLARLGTYLFFQKIYFANENRIPRDKPVILAINHPTGFMEPIIMAVLLKKPLHFLVRGDFFSKKIYGALLRALHMIPIFRMRDNTGFSGVKSNFSTFEACYAGLKSGKIIMIFPEGRTVLEKRLRPLQRGLVRIAFGTLERYPELEDLFIVPVGVNFTDGEGPRGKVMINFGEPLSARSFYRNGAAVEGDQLLEALAQEMAKNIIIVEDPADDVLAEQLLTLDRSERKEKLFPMVEDASDCLWREKNIADRINSMESGEKTTLKTQTEAYFKALKAAQTNDKAVAKSGSTQFGIGSLLGLIPAYLGYIFGFLPAQLAYYIKHKQVRRLEYKMPVWACASWGAFLVYYLFWLVLAATTGQWLILLGSVLLGGFGWFSLYYFEYLVQWRNEQKFKGLEAKLQQQLQEQRQHLLPFIQNN
jgi:glycerol-3-phosphate O-acyltransferase / dihydroxyacetone phosphate acyltransferase